MLILNRKQGECIVIGENIRVYVTEVGHGGKVKIGVECDRSIPVHRLEVVEKILKEGRK